MYGVLDLWPGGVGLSLCSGKTVLGWGGAPNPQLLSGCRIVSCPLLRVWVHLDGLSAENTFFAADYTPYNCVCDK